MPVLRGEDLRNLKSNNEFRFAKARCPAYRRTWPRAVVDRGEHRRQRNETRRTELRLNLETCRALAAALLLVGAAPSRAAEPASSGDWQFGLDAHLWGVAIGGMTVVDVEASDPTKRLI